MKLFISFLVSLSILCHFGPPSPIPINKEIIDGVTLVAPPREFHEDPVKPIKNTGAGWISCVPYGFTLLGESKIRYNVPGQWWGEKKEGILKTIDYAHTHDIKVMLKPQIWSHSGWIGDQAFDTEKEWLDWEKHYTEFIMFFADIAAQHDVEMLCIGTELKQHIRFRPEYYKQLIPKIREIYCGKLIYSANWDSYAEVPFWDQLDYIGLSAYFPLSEKNTPKITDLKKSWRPICRKLNELSKAQGKKIVFTEFGYLSVDGAGGRTWELEKNVHNLKINEQAQAACYQALFDVFSKEDYWGGGFLWKWFPLGMGGEGYNAKDYTPQGKEAENVLKDWYTKW